jgi:hypothetical protein
MKLLVSWWRVVEVDPTTTLSLVGGLTIGQHSSLQDLACRHLNLIPMVVCCGCNGSRSLFRRLSVSWVSVSLAENSISKGFWRDHCMLRTRVSALAFRRILSYRALLNVLSHDLIDRSLRVELILLLLWWNFSMVIDRTCWLLGAQFLCTCLPIFILETKSWEWEFHMEINLH